MRNFIAITVLLLMGYSLRANAQHLQSSNPLIGTWKFVADQQVDDAGKVVRQDKDVTGMLIYTNEGTMSVQFYWKGKRRSILTDSIMNQDGISFGLGLGKNTWTADEARTIIDTYDAYWGDYYTDLKNHIVTHVIGANLRPEKDGTVYKRKYKIEGNNLYLRSIDPRMKWQVWLIKFKRK